MNPSSRIRRSVTLLACLACCPGVPAGELQGLVPPTEKVAGRSQAEWSTAWWQWAASFDRAEGPVADRTGEKCGLKQSGAVWFLAGTYGTRRTVRSCTIPRGTYLFFPLINYVFSPTDPTDPLDPPTCAAVTRNAKRATDGASSLVLDIDGQRAAGLEQHRLASLSCFNLTALATPASRVFPAAANGYYVMLRPLPAGTHELNFGGVLPDMMQAVTYRLTVE